MKNKIFVLTFSLLLALLTAANLAAPKKDFSENENRSLAKAPELTLSSIRDGSFTADLAEYLADHFIFRDFWVSLKSLAEQTLLKTDNNGVFKGKDGYLLDSFSLEDTENFAQNLDAAAEFCTLTQEEFGVQTRVMIAPTAIQILQDKLPAFAVTADSGALYDRAAQALPGWIDIRAPLTEHRDEYIYYRTDHHWTALGAYLAYGEYQKAMNLPVKSLEDFQPETVSDSFFGTTYSRYGFFNGQNADTLTAPAQNALISLRITDSRGEETALYHPEKLDGKDKYQYFLGGNEPILHISTENKNGKRLLLIKDSYANAFLPYIVGDWETITVIDMRYYQGVVPQLLREDAITDALILYNLKSFSQDKYLPFINFTE